MIHEVQFTLGFPPCLHAVSSCGVKVPIDHGATSSSTVLIDINDLLPPGRALRVTA